jgi:uncharacterized protein YlxP (DUF503 family)
MFVGTLKFEVIIPGSKSLKDKRRVIQSLQNKIKAKFNVSIAEIDHQDKWQRSIIGLCFVNSAQKEIENISQKIREIFIENGDILILNELSEIFYIGEK